MYAGTQSILVTHTIVEAQASRDLMVITIQQMQRYAKPQALQEAKRKMKGSTRPYPDDPSG
jgi:CHAT domain-containing protein